MTRSAASAAARSRPARSARSSLDDLGLGPESCVIYLRISQDRTGEGLGVERQERDCRTLARRLGLHVEHVYTDNDVSATNGKVRPEFERMLLDQPEAVVAWHQDRLLRLTSDLEKVIAIDVPVYTVTAGTLDLATPAGRAVARTVAAWSTYEGEQKALRQRAANLQRAERGHWHFSRRPYGYRRDGSGKDAPVVQVPEEAAIIREGYERYLSGETYYAIANDWNERGVPTLGGKDGKQETVWSMTRVRALLRNERYAGLASYKGVAVEPERLTWEPIIDRETWHTYLAVREGRAVPHSWSSATKHLLSGLVVCGECGARMLARPEYRRQSDGSRRTRMSYQCREKWCTSRGLDDVDGLVEGVVLARLADPRIVAGLRKAPDVAPLDAELKDLRNRRKNVTELLADGLLDRREARLQAEKLTAKIDALVKRRNALRARSPLTDLALARSIPAKWEALSVLDKRRAIDELGLVVTIEKTPPGRRPFDAKRVRIEWRDATGSVVASEADEIVA